MTKETRLTGEALAQHLAHAGLDGPGTYRIDAAAPTGSGAVHPFHGHEALFDAFLAGAARGRRDVAAAFAIHAATDLAAALPVGTLVTGAPLLLPEKGGLAVVLGPDGWPLSLHVAEASLVCAPAEAARAGAALGELLDPLVTTLARLGGRGTRSLWRIATTRVGYCGGEHAGRVSDLSGAAVEEMLAEIVQATAPSPQRALAFRSYRHARGVYRASVFTGCCLGYRLERDDESHGDGCPFCPRLPAARQMEAVAAWIDALDDRDVPAGIPGIRVRRPGPLEPSVRLHRNTIETVEGTRAPPSVDSELSLRRTREDIR